MRDDKYIIGSRGFLDWGVKPTLEEDLWFIGSTGHLTADTCRDEPVSTVPTASGGFHLPTIYRAHFCRMRGHHYNMMYTSSAPYHPYTYHRVEGEAGTGFWPMPFNTHGCGNAMRPYAPQIPLWLQSACESDALQEMKARNFDLGVFLAELPESVEAIGGLIEAVYASFEWTNKRSRRLNTKDAAKMWLGWQLGVKPLAVDIYRIGTEFVNGFSPPPFMKVLVSRLDRSFEPMVPPPYGYISVWKDASTYRRGVTVEIQYRVGNPYLYNLDSLGLINPLSLLWERMPLSFVVDYFVSVGDLLSAMTAPVGVDFVAGGRTTWVNNSYDVTYAPNAYDGEPEGSLPRLTGSLKAMARTVYPGFPLPIPWGHIPASATKWLNMISLMRARWT